MEASEAIDETRSTQEESSPEQPVQDQSAQEAKAFTPFIRIDRDDPKAAERDLENLRVITEGKYELEEPKAKYGIDPNFVPDLTGLDTLNVSASAQFNERQFRELAKTLRDVANGKEIYIYRSSRTRRSSSVRWQERSFRLLPRMTTTGEKWHSTSRAT